MTKLGRFELCRQHSVGRRAFSVFLLNSTSAFDSRILHQKGAIHRSDGETGGKPNASSKSDRSENPKAERKEWTHNLHMSPATVHHMEAVFSIVRKIYERGPDDRMDDLDVNVVFWSIFLNATLRASVHLGQDHEANLRYVKNHLWSSVKQLFSETGKPNPWTIREHGCEHD